MTSEKLRMRFVDPMSVTAGDIISDGDELAKIMFVNKTANLQYVVINGIDSDGHPCRMRWLKGKPIMKVVDPRVLNHQA